MAMPTKHPNVPPIKAARGPVVQPKKREGSIPKSRSACHASGGIWLRALAAAVAPNMAALANPMTIFTTPPITAVTAPATAPAPAPSPAVWISSPPKLTTQAPTPIHRTRVPIDEPTQTGDQADQGQNYSDDPAYESRLQTRLYPDAYLLGKISAPGASSLGRVMYYIKDGSC